MKLTNKKVIKLFEEHQANPMVHPFTCGNNSTHRLLKAVERKGNVVLVCLDCDYVQTYLPSPAPKDLFNKS